MLSARGKKEREASGTSESRFQIQVPIEYLDLGRGLLAVEEIGPTSLAEWSSLTQTRVSISGTDPPAHGLWQSVRELGGGELRVEISGDAERRVLGNARRNLLTSGAIALLLAFAASLPLARALVRPIQRIGEASRRIHSGDLAVRLRSGRHDEPATR